MMKAVLFNNRCINDSCCTFKFLSLLSQTERREEVCQHFVAQHKSSRGVSEEL